MRIGTLIAAGLTAIAASVFAAPAMADVATTTVNVRATPGGSIVDVMRSGESATVTGQSGSWCEVNRRGAPDGWVACRYLASDDGEDDEDVVAPSRPQPDVNISFSVPGFSFSIGQGDFDRPGRPGGGRNDRVCFFEHVNFGGDSFCARPGERIRSLGDWNDRISSIRVRGDARALVCEHNNFQGRCVVIDRNVRNLGQRGNDIISSIRVR